MLYHWIVTLLLDFFFPQSDILLTCAVVPALYICLFEVQLGKSSISGKSVTSLWLACLGAICSPVHEKMTQAQRRMQFIPLFIFEDRIKKSNENSSIFFICLITMAERSMTNWHHSSPSSESGCHRYCFKMHVIPLQSLSQSRTCMHEQWKWLVWKSTLYTMHPKDDGDAVEMNSLFFTKDLVRFLVFSAFIHWTVELLYWSLSLAGHGIVPCLISE